MKAENKNIKFSPVSSAMRIHHQTETFARKPHEKYNFGTLSTELLGIGVLFVALFNF